VPPTVPAAALPAQARRQLIAERIALDGFVSVAGLAAELAVSEVTVRTDLDGLERTGVLRRVHGGALPATGSVRESSVEATAELDADVKRRIGRKAAGLVADGSSLLLDVGSTTLAVARALVARSDLTDIVVITNGLSIALALEPAIPRFTVVVTGGTLRPLQHSLVNPMVSAALAGLHVDLAIIGCTGIDDAGNVTNVNLPEAEVKREMVAAAARSILVADASKLGRRHLGLVGALSDFDTLVMAGAGAEHATPIAEAAGIRFLGAT
jgi:DeoR family transcriptional regulator, aga operon transcriptional repressor